MARAIITILAALVCAHATASTTCENGQCNDETSLVQVKANVKAHQPRHHGDDVVGDGAGDDVAGDGAGDDLSDGHVVPLRTGDPQVDFDAAADKHASGSKGRETRTLLTRRNEDGSTYWEGSDCLTEVDFEGSGGFPHCRSEDAPADLPCNACIEDQWATHSAAGFACCDDMAKKKEGSNLAKQPLCGICLRAKVTGGLAGSAGAKQDQTRFAKCAEYYCQLKDLRGKAITTALLQNVAHHCSPEETHNTGPAPEENMVAIVANNPRKGELESFLKAHDTIAADVKSITGTASSSKMAFCVTKATKAGFNTESGPWGGDAQLAGLIASQCSGGNKKYLRAIVFFADKDEAHQEDILSLKNLMERCFSSSDIAFDPAQGESLVEGLSR